MRKRLFSLLFLYILIGTTAVSAFTWQHEVRLGEPVLIYHNDTLLYNITFDINKADNLTYALIQDIHSGRLLVENVDWHAFILNGTNITIVSTRKDIKNRTVYVLITGPDIYRVLLQSELKQKTLTNVTVANQTNVTAPVNSTLQSSNQTANLTPVNVTPVVIPQNIACNSTEECQQIIANLTAQLKKLKAERDALLKQIQYLKQQLNMTMTENKQLREQIKILEKALQEKNEEIARLQEQIAELQKQQWSWKTFREKSEEQYLLWTPYAFPIVLASLVVYYRRYKRTKKYMDVKIDMKAKELKEELLSEYLKKDLLKAKIETIVDDPNLLVILRTIIPQITGSQEITKGDILELDIDQVAELARKKFLLKENRVEYLKKKLLELKEKIREEAGGNV